jgi:uncharacterized membrane protein
LTAPSERQKTAEAWMPCCYSVFPSRFTEECMAASRSRSWYNPLAVFHSLMLRPRVYGAALAGILAIVLLPKGWPQTVRSSIAFDLGGIVYLIFAFHLIATCGSDRIRARAARRDDSRIVILGIVLLAIAASFAAIAGLIGYAKLPQVGATEKGLIGALAVITIMISWTVTQVAFALHYARDYYRPDAGSDSGAGLAFPSCESPDYWDFLYFSTSIGATSQTSDTSVRSRALRRLVTLHSVIAFFFNTAVLALTVNIAASLAG